LPRENYRSNLNDPRNGGFARASSLICTVLALGLLTAIYFAFRYQIDFWWFNFWYSLPVIGKLARLSKDTTRSSNSGWLRAEETLCGDYRKHIIITSEAEFRKRLTYMAKAQDIGRRPLSGWMVAMLAVLLMAEGLGFSYLLGTWLAREGSANVHTLLMLAIVFVICMLMLWLTHAAGHQLYRTGLVKSATKEWRDSGQQGPLITADVKLDDDQSIDDREPRHTQLVNRVGSRGGYAMVAVTAVGIVGIACLSTWMRISHLNQEMIEQVTQRSSPAAAGNPFSTSGVPAELATPQAAADNKAIVEDISNQKSEGLAAFIMLAIIFVVTQILGIYAGWKFGFAGRESKGAHQGIQGFSTYDDYMNRYEPMIQIGQAKLQTLQRNLGALGGNFKLEFHKTFDDYILEA
jgi:hypothetical protein